MREAPIWMLPLLVAGAMVSISVAVTALRHMAPANGRTNASPASKARSSAPGWTLAAGTSIIASAGVFLSIPVVTVLGGVGMVASVVVLVRSR